MTGGSASGQSIKTRFLILSDTHSARLRPSTHAQAFREPLPRADVLLHCGDLTNYGELDEYKKTLEVLKSARAELKLVIAGNHDLTLDGDWWRAQRSDGGPLGLPEDHDKAVQMWTGDAARDAGVTYLEEGTYTFELQSGARFTVYASPYQPEFCGWAFPYARDQDRFNPAHTVSAPTKPIAANPVPDFPGVDVMLTHGPPLHHLDTTMHGRDVGCAHLRRALRRARPRLHCFGHIHEGWGAELVAWKGAAADGEDGGVESVARVENPDVVDGRCAHIDISASGARPQTFGESTLCVNAAIMNVMYRPVNRPWLIDLDLPLKTG